MKIEYRDKKYLGREGNSRGLEIVRSRGSYVYDSKRRKYIDFFMGWCVGNVGWGVKEITSSIQSFKGPTYVGPGFLYRPWAELAEILAKIAPGKLVKSFRATGGTEAVEIALQAAMAHTTRHKFISIEGSYHGHSIGAMSIGMSGFRKWYKNLLFHCHKVKPPLDVNAAKKVVKLLKNRDIAAFISEPVVCNLGVVIPTKEFVDIVQKACKKYGTLFVADEVATGFGRTGKMFACEHYGIKPDIICLAKGVTGGFGALGVTMMTKEVAKSFEFGFSFYSTFGWHPLNVAASVANLKYFLRNKAKLLNNADKMSRYFENRLKTMKFKYPTEIRIKGLAIGVEFKNNTYAGKIITKAQKKGLLLADATANNFVMYPALDISMTIAKKGLDILESCL